MYQGFQFINSPLHHRGRRVQHHSHGGMAGAADSMAPITSAPSFWCPILVTQTHIGAPRLHSPTFKSHGKVRKQGGDETKEPKFFLFKKFQ